MNDIAIETHVFPSWIEESVPNSVLAYAETGNGRFVAIVIGKYADAVKRVLSLSGHSYRVL